MTYKPLPLPFDYLSPDYGLFGPVVDGMIIVRQLVQEHIPDFSWDIHDADEDAIRIHNEYKQKTIYALNHRIEQAKQAYAKGFTH